MKPEQQVILIVDRFYGQKLRKLRQKVPVVPIWIVDSAANHSVIRDLWQSRTTVPGNHLEGITSFVDKADLSPEELAESMLDVIELHHGADSCDAPWNSLLILGACKNDELVETMTALGFHVHEECKSALEFRR